MKTLFAGPMGIVGGLVLVVLIGATLGFTLFKNNRGGKILTDTLAEPLNDTTAAKVDINAGSGNLTIDRLPAGEPLLASGTLEYAERLGLPVRTLNSINGQTSFSLRTGDSGRTGFRFPWDACNSEINWLIHLNTTVATDLTAFSGGGNLKLDLAGMLVTKLSAETGGGNVDVVLPDKSTDLNVMAKTGAGNVAISLGSGATGSSTVNASSGAGNVAVHLPSGIAARVYLSSGIGKAIIDPRFSKIDDQTYQSPDYASAANKIDITLQSGAGNVSVDTK
jgi:hypothetical protein